MLFMVDSPDKLASVNTLTEATDSGEKKYYIEGVFAQAELKNRNGRIYPKNVLENAVNKFMPMIEAKRALGELNHPQTPSINPERASHLIQKLEWKDNNLMGRAKVLTSLPMGKIARGLIDEGVSFGVSTRGMGSVRDIREAKVVQDDFMMNTIDLVSDPSGIDCFVSGIMENKEWIFDVTTGSWIIAEQIQKEIKSLDRTEIIEQKLNLFHKFLNSIK